MGYYKPLILSDSESTFTMRNKTESEIKCCLEYNKNVVIRQTFFINKQDTGKIINHLKQEFNIKEY